MFNFITPQPIKFPKPDVKAEGEHTPEPPVRIDDNPTGGHEGSVIVSPPSPMASVLGTNRVKDDRHHGVLDIQPGRSRMAAVLVKQGGTIRPSTGGMSAALKVVNRQNRK